LFFSLCSLTLELFAKKRVFWRFWRFSGWNDFGQISFNLVENEFATGRLDVLATSITLYEILARACAEIKILKKVTYVFRLFDF